MTDEVTYKVGDKYYIKMTVNIPIADQIQLHKWTISCQAKEPIGYNDYRWGKILSDHLFRVEFGDKLQEIINRLKALEEQKEKGKSSNIKKLMKGEDNVSKD